MSYSNGTYNHARLNFGITPKASKPRYTLQTPDRQVAFRQENIATEKTTLFLKPRGDVQSQDAFRITYKDGIPAFTATGREYGDHSCRELRHSQEAAVQSV